MSMANIANWMASGRRWFWCWWFNNNWHDPSPTESMEDAVVARLKEEGHEDEEDEGCTADDDCESIPAS